MYLKGFGKKAKTGISIKEKWLEQKMYWPFLSGLNW